MPAPNSSACSRAAAASGPEATSVAGALSSVTSATRRVRSNDTSSDTVAADASTTYSAGPSGPAAGTTSRSATDASATVPTRPLKVPEADTVTDDGKPAPGA